MYLRYKEQVIDLLFIWVEMNTYNRGWMQLIII